MPQRRKFKVDPAAVVAYAIANPTMRQADIGAHFGILKSHTNDILSAAGIKGRHKADYAEVVAYRAANPDMSQADVGVHFGISRFYVRRILSAAGIKGRRKGPKPKADYEAVVAYAKANPILHYAAIGKHFGISQRRVSHILSAAGIVGICPGRHLKHRAWRSDEQEKWEVILHDCGLGMHRGEGVHGVALIYGYDSSSVRRGHVSATLHDR